MRILQVLPSIMRMVDDELEIDNDFCESLRVTLDNFDQATVACPIAMDILDSGLRRSTPVKDLPWRARVRFIPL